MENKSLEESNSDHRTLSRGKTKNPEKGHVDPNLTSSDDIAAEKATKAPTPQSFDHSGPSFSRESPPSPERLKDVETGSCDFEENCLLILDDHLCGSSSLKTDSASVKEQNENYQKTLRFIQQCLTIFCHHYKFHLILTSQQPLSTSGSSLTAQCLRTIRTNLDCIVILPSVLRDIRTMLQNMFSGEDYVFVKRWFFHLTQSIEETPSDPRLFRPYIVILLNPQTNKNLRFR